MCDRCGNLTHHDELAALARRKLLLAGAGLAAAPLLAGMASDAHAQQGAPPAGTGPFKARAWAAPDKAARFAPTEINRRGIGPKDVRIDVLYAGICHSDIHTARAEWGPPASYPVVPGHEIVGRVTAIGNAVTKFRVGDIAGVGVMVDSCGTCENCLADREQNCLNGATFTYDSPDKVSGGLTYGGYSTALVVAEHFGIRIPPGVNLAGMAPILCAGITTFSPMQHWRLQRGQRVAVIGLGGLGHMAVKLAVARGAEVTVFTTTPGKVEDARRFGAREAVLWSDQAAFGRLANHFDLMIATVPKAFPVQQFMNLLKLDATLVNVGALEDLNGLNGMANGFGRKSLAGSMVGGIAETQEVVDYCVARNISADVEIIRPDQINMAWDRVVNKDVRYRFVIDMGAA
ncbi:NAD(P)-dependent alcohol dehydrogenase [Ancylobacter polymorphus]|uniref:NAD(P)-dependent alcohol dehydrogenase n=1 Tax=Ancylobacter polymorphus TaxID=223390 RepID=A0A9E7A072_9HYPH|nr:NAD(P)-dependent alcohol dehydrogenase [Ancylobacter polymorphus]UOK73497.1 NAD(P)-dependent alcohol dehydrogenase [Ancylobacter polymorphus]